MKQLFTLFCVCTTAALATPINPAVTNEISKPLVQTEVPRITTNKIGSSLAAPQTISFPPLGTKTIGDADIILNASSTSGLPISYSSSNPAVASVNNGLLLIHGTGTVDITASQPGNSSYLPATPVVQTLTVQENIITVQVQFTGSAAGTSANLADLKYNKQVMLNFEVDDGPSTFYSLVYKYLHGGVAGDGVTYPGLTFTDGCGNNLKYKASIAYFILNTIGDEMIGNPGAPQYVSWTQLQEMNNNGWGLINHQYGGRDSVTRDRGYQVYMHTRVTYDRLKALGSEVRLRSLVVPSADHGYTATALALGYNVVSSQFGNDCNDDFPFISGVNGDVGSIPVANMLLSRGHTGDMFESTDDAKAAFDNIMTAVNASASVRKMYRIFTHGPFGPTDGFTAFKDFFSYLHANSLDKIWSASTQESSEYFEVKDKVIKTESISGNTLTITLNLSNLPEHNRYRDMSLLISGGATISNVIVTGADGSSFNPSTRLVNVFEQKTNFRSPSLDTIAPRITALSVTNANTKQIAITYDRAITQSLAGAFSVRANNVNNPVVSVAGSGTDWTIGLQNDLAFGQTILLDYRMQNGNAVDASSNNQRVTSYVNQIVTNNIFVSLPVALKDFRAVKKGAAVLLQWQTDMEMKSDKFEILHSTDGITWKNIGIVKAAGSSSVRKFYEHNHLTPSDGLNQYRLRSVDLDGQATLTDIQLVYFDRSIKQPSVFPNPVSGNIATVDVGRPVAKPIAFIITDVTGRIISRGQITQRYTDLQITDIASGIYLLRVGNNQAIRICKQ